MSCTVQTLRRHLVPFGFVLLVGTGCSEEADSAAVAPPDPMTMPMPMPMPEDDPPPAEKPAASGFSIEHPVGLYPREALPAKVAYLTFDDGPADWTGGFLDILAAKGVKATFFDNGNVLVATKLDGGYTDPATSKRVLYRDNLKRILDEGHALGNHSQTHTDLATLDAAGIASELDHNQTIINQALRKSGAPYHPLTLIRPPYGSPFISRLDPGKLTATDHMLLAKVGAGVAERGLNVLWNVESTDAADWAIDEWYTSSQPQPPGKASMYTFAQKVERIKTAVLTDPQVMRGDGVIILFHETHPCSRDALPDIIDGLRAAGYTFGTIEQLAQSRWSRPSADLAPGPHQFDDKYPVKDWGCQDYSIRFGPSRHQRAHEVCGRTWRFFAELGGGAVFDLPDGEPQLDRVTAMGAQWFHNSRLELHPDQDRPLDVQPAPLGEQRLQQLGVAWRTTALPMYQEEAAEQPSCVWLTFDFKDGGRKSQHNVCDTITDPQTGQQVEVHFAAFWNKFPQALQAFGYPISSTYKEPSSGRFVQWFQRARFEWNPALSQVQPAPLGDEVRAHP